MFEKKMKELGAYAIDGDEIPYTDNELSVFLSKVPASHIQRLRYYDGAIVFENSVKFKPEIHIPVSDEQGFLSLEILYGLKNNENGIAYNNKVYSGEIGEGICTIGSSSGGDQICIEMNSGKVYYWWHEAQYDNETLFKITNSFDDFLDMLVSDVHSSGNDNGVLSINLDF